MLTFVVTPSLPEYILNTVININALNNIASAIANEMSLFSLIQQPATKQILKGRSNFCSGLLLLGQKLILSSAVLICLLHHDF